MLNIVLGRRKGISVPIATMFMILIIVLSIAFMLFLIHRIGEISRTGVQVVREEREKMAENAELFIVKINVTNGDCMITFGLLNTGSLTLTPQHIYAFLIDKGNYTDIPLVQPSFRSISPGECLYFNITIPYIIPNETRYYLFKLLSTRGNVYSTYLKLVVPMAYLFVSPPVLYNGCVGSVWLVVINNSTSPLFNLTPILSYSPEDVNISISNATPTSIDRLPPGATAIFFWNITVNSLGTAENVTFTAYFLSLNVSVSANRTVGVVPTPRISTISAKIIIENNLCRSGDNVTIIVNVTNFGPNDVNNVTPVISLIGKYPQSISVQYALLDSPQTIPANSFAVFRYNLTCQGRGTIIVFVYAYGYDSVTGHTVYTSEVASREIYVREGGNLSCVIFAPSTVISGFNTTIAIRVRNTGDVDVYNVSTYLSLSVIDGDADIVLGPLPVKIDVLPSSAEAFFKYIINVTGTSATKITLLVKANGTDVFGIVVENSTSEVLYVRELIAVSLEVRYEEGNLPPSYGTVVILHNGSYANATLYVRKPPYYRVLVNITSPFRRINFPTPVFINFTKLLEDLGVAGTLDINSIRVLNATTLREIPYNYTTAAGFNALTNACMWIVFPANITPGSISQVYIYFNTLENGPAQPPSQYYNVSYVDTINNSTAYDTEYYIVLKFPHIFYELSSLTYILYGDDNYVYQSFGFTFPFYGLSYRGAYVCTNGYMDFRSGRAEWRTVPYTTYFTPYRIIAPFQMDLYAYPWPSAIGVYRGTISLYNLQGIGFYYNMLYYGYLTSYAVFETILLESGDIIFTWNRIDRYYGWTSSCLYFYSGISRGDTMNYIIVSSSDPSLYVPVNMTELTSTNVLFVYKPNLVTMISSPEIDYNSPFEAAYTGFFNYTVIIRNLSPINKWQVRFSFDRIEKQGSILNFTVIVYNETFYHKQIIVEYDKVVKPISSWFEIDPQSDAYVIISISTTDKFKAQLYLETKIAYRDDLYGYILPFTINVVPPP